MEETFAKMGELVSKVENEISMLEKATKKVVIYSNDNIDLMYGLMNTDANQVCKGENSIHNIMPSPHPSLMKLFDSDDKLSNYSNIPNSITNGNGDVYTIKFVSYLHYLKMYAKEIKNSYNEINVLINNEINVLINKNQK